MAIRIKNQLMVLKFIFKKYVRKPMDKYFSGFSFRHYIEPLQRIDLNEILSLIAQKKYFVLHAPRQMGKTTLFEQHTEENGQEFHKDVFPLVWEQTEGQPWLTNALAYEVCFEMKAGRDRKKEITVDMVVQAKENLILRRDTHLDQLVDDMREDRVKQVLAPILAGSDELWNVQRNDIESVIDLGLIAANLHLRIANPIYRELMERENI